MISEGQIESYQKFIDEWTENGVSTHDVLSGMYIAKILLEERKELINHRDLSFAVIEACEYHKGKLPKELREKLDFWFQEYKIDG